ncbi:hypothetical protein ROHU_008545 [Labeo rohita]|uniref:Uncharacterized protein n=1 Tax=Labeo rohita TaxID=84645 RepID=A0A498M4Z5_LABRO|nr:hypothetical protein ROHU_031416 [Labeo rohita]RXN15948.1 hypothetical protein ROHU_008545 [Labeo rohita]
MSASFAAVPPGSGTESRVAAAQTTSHDNSHDASQQAMTTCASESSNTPNGILWDLMDRGIRDESSSIPDLIFRCDGSCGPHSKCVCRRRDAGASLAIQQTPFADLITMGTAALIECPVIGPSLNGLINKFVGRLCGNVVSYIILRF